MIELKAFVDMMLSASLIHRIDDPLLSMELSPNRFPNLGVSFYSMKHFNLVLFGGSFLLATIMNYDS